MAIDIEPLNILFLGAKVFEHPIALWHKDIVEILGEQDDDNKGTSVGEWGKLFASYKSEQYYENDAKNGSLDVQRHSFIGDVVESNYLVRFKSANVVLEYRVLFGRKGCENGGDDKG
jgi:hypothetical protein